MNTEHQNWQVETATSSRSEDIEYFIRRDGDSVAVASDIINPETEQPSKEIADLLCAAPELLEALGAIVAFDTPLPCGLLQQARAAIAKAEGKA